MTENEGPDGANKGSFSVGILDEAAEGLLQGIGRDKNPADYARERVTALIESFQANIDNDVEVGISVVGSGSAAPFRLRAIRASNPDILIFDGVDDRGNVVQLLQHYSQMALMLVVVPKLEERPFRMGF
jgi:Family of unknown function (DUF6173)